MTQIELIAVETIVDATEELTVELSLSELDMVGGGNAISTNL